MEPGMMIQKLTQPSKKPGPGPVGLLQELVIAAGPGKQARQFGIGQGPAKRQQAADNPDADKPERLRQFTGQEAAGGENTGTDDIAHHQQNGIP